MKLFKTRTRLTSNRKQIVPVRSTLRLIQTKIKHMRKQNLVVSPSLIKSAITLKLLGEAGHQQRSRIQNNFINFMIMAYKEADSRRELARDCRSLLSLSNIPHVACRTESRRQSPAERFHRAYSLDFNWTVNSGDQLMNWLDSNSF